MLRFSACQYVIPLCENWDAYAAHLRTLTGEAAETGAQLLLLPEYAAMALTGLLPSVERADLHRSIVGIQPFIPHWLSLCAAIAHEHGVHFCPGSAPVVDADGIYRNRAFLFGPKGCVGHQDKLIMTRFEREQWFIGAGVNGLRVFETPLGRLGILICYDNEFPMLARRLAEQRVDLILAPSCTDTQAGAHRVRIGAQARALENQFAVLVSPTAGLALWSPAVDENFGRAGLYVPSDYGMPPDGIFAQSDDIFSPESRWLHGEIDLAQVAALRTHGQVALFRDWPEQFEV